MPNLEYYEGREQGYVKHALIERYIEQFAIVISSKWDAIVYIDAFAGPWGAEHDEYEDTSFCIALNALQSGVEVAEKTHGRKLSVDAYLIEKEVEPFAELSRFGESRKREGFDVTCVNGAFEDVASNLIPPQSANAFTFALIDPKGWKGLSMKVMAPILSGRSCEVLVNVMTSFISRFAKTDSCKDSYTEFFGRQGVRELIADASPEDREDIIVQEYCRSLRDICGFEYVSSCVVLHQDKKGIKYFMVYGTNHPRGIQVFKNAESFAANIQDDLKRKKRERFNMELSLGSSAQVSEVLRKRYREKSFARVIELLQTNNTQTYADVFCKAMAMPLVTEAELICFLEEHTNIKIVYGSGKARRKPSIKSTHKDTVMWVV